MYKSEKAVRYENIAKALELRIDQHSKSGGLVTLNKALALALAEALREMAKAEGGVTHHRDGV